MLADDRESFCWVEIINEEIGEDKKKGVSIAEFEL